MAKRRYSTYSRAGLALVTTAETVIATLVGPSTDQAGQTLAFRGTAVITTGTTTTAVQLRVRVGSLAGALVGVTDPDTLFAAIGATETHTIYVEDQTGAEFSGRTYVLTAQQTAATANGTAVSASLELEMSP